MRRLLLAALLLTAGVARAGEPGPKWWSVLYPSYHCCPKCPDDYCPKPLPCATPWRYCGPDDYCPKPLPCATPWRYCAPDDYCPKPPPPLPAPCLPRR